MFLIWCEVWCMDLCWRFRYCFLDILLWFLRCLCCLCLWCCCFFCWKLLVLFLLCRIKKGWSVLVVLVWLLLVCCWRMYFLCCWCWLICFLIVNLLFICCWGRVFFGWFRSVEVMMMIWIGVRWFLCICCIFCLVLFGVYCFILFYLFFFGGLV